MSKAVALGAGVLDLIPSQNYSRAMTLNWIREESPSWDEDKRKVIGQAPAGVFDRRFSTLEDGARLPGQWWRAEDEDGVAGYGWLDAVWGDAEITLATAPSQEGKGVGSFVLQQLISEADKMGLNYVYNTVRPNHPDKDKVVAWLTGRGFHASPDGSLFFSR